MKRIGPALIVWLAFGLIAVAAAAPASAADNATVRITVMRNGNDVTNKSSGLIVHAGGAFAGQLQQGPDGLGASLPPGQYKIIIVFHGDSGGNPAMPKPIEFQLKAGQTLKKTVTLPGGNTPSLQQRMAAMMSGMSEAQGGQSTGASGVYPDTARLDELASCMELPNGYFGDDYTSSDDQLNVKPTWVFPNPKVLKLGVPADAPPAALQFDTMWVKNVQAQVIANAVQKTLDQVPMAIIWADWDGADKLLAHASDLLPRLADADKASQLAEARLLRLFLAPVLQKNPPPVLDIDDPVKMTQAFAAWQQKVQQNGLSPKVVSQLKGAGWTDDEIAAFTARAAHAPSGQVATETVVGAVLAVATILHDEEASDGQATAIKAKLDTLRKGVANCGPTL